MLDDFVLSCMPMTKEDARSFLLVLRALEKLCLQSFALQFLLEMNKIPHWKEVSDKFVSDPIAHPEIRELFRRIYDWCEQTPHSSESVDLEQLLRLIPTPGEPN